MEVKISGEKWPCAFYPCSPADGVTPFPHAVSKSGQVYLPAKTNVNDANGVPTVWRKQRCSEFIRWQRGEAVIIDW